jgi:hypothetical protein
MPIAVEDRHGERYTEKHESFREAAESIAESSKFGTAYPIGVIAGDTIYYCAAGFVKEGKMKKSFINWLEKNDYDTDKDLELLDIYDFE